MKALCSLEYTYSCSTVVLQYVQCTYVPVHVLRSNPVPAAKRFQIDFLIKSSCYENTVLFAQYATLIQIKLQ
jgi:hypothetical protein